MKQKAFQDFYPDDVNHCYGCGQLNAHGHRLRTFWDGDLTVSYFTPREYHTAIPGFVYGGLLASLIDCHGTASAAAASFRQEGRDMDSLPVKRFVTGSLNVKYLKPTPLGPELKLVGRIREVKGKKVVVDIDLFAQETLCVQGQVVAIQLPDHWTPNI